MKTPVISILYFVVASLLGAIGQYLYKSGAETSHGGLAGYATNPRILSGAVCYVAVMALFVAAFKRGGELAVLYPVYATTFIWAAVLSFFVYQTPIRPVNWLGMLLLIAGMYCMGR